MNANDMLRDVIESVFGSEAHTLTDDDGPGSIEAWDSVGHLNLILTIESVFGIQFATDEIPDLVTIGMIRERVEQG